MALFGLFKKEEKEILDRGLVKTRESFFGKLTRAVAGKSKIDDCLLDKLEEVLISSDVGVDTTLRIIERISKRVARDKYVDSAELNSILKEEIAGLLEENKSTSTLVSTPASASASTSASTSAPGSARATTFTFDSPLPSKPYVILVVGVNGVGKTTTIAKLAYNFRKAGKSVLLGAADTFRAAAIDQLKIWAERAGVPIVAQQMGSDPASVAFDTVKSAVAAGTDVVIIDTAGRLHNKINLMNELSKIKRVMEKVVAGAPHEVLLVLDGSTGQNAFEQAKQFTAATEVNALAVTKLDGTAKGGVVIGISDQFKIPVRYIGVGEKMEDLRIFDRYAFVDSFFTP